MTCVDQTLRSTGKRLYNVATDGDARRRRALIGITLSTKVDPSSPLAGLPLFNTRCGQDELLMDFDWKHVFKRFRNTLLRQQKGFSINGIPISKSTLRQHLIDCGTPGPSVDALLEPNDKQDVVLMIKLLNTIANLPAASSTDSPVIHSTRRVLRLLGNIYRHLLSAYLDIELSLHEQLAHLSAASHLILAVYNRDKGEFIPVQTFFDVMSMIKNVFFCVVKIQKDNPEGKFYIVLLGTDGLEKLFGKVRTMVGNDTNTDILQLLNRIDGAVQCVKILEIRPELGGQPRRLNIKALPKDSNDISSKFDHISPRSWKGDVDVKNVVVASSWSAGQKMAVKELEEAQFDPSFERMQAAGGYDILCPFGGDKMVLVDGVTAGERDETEEEVDEPTIVAEPSQSDVTHLSDATPDEPDMDDASIVADLTDTATSNAIPEPWINIVDSANSRKAHKASILRIYSSPLTISESKDRLKRVRGYSRYNETKNKLAGSSTDTGNLEEADDSNVLCVLDPALTVVQCNERVFLAVFQVSGIRQDSKDVQSLPLEYINEPNVRISGQVMQLSLISSTPSVDEPDWEWTGTFEPRGFLRDIEGSWIEVIDPALQAASSKRTTLDETYGFRTSELRGMAAILYERTKDDMSRLPSVPVTDSFPYRSETGQACFVCESDVLEGTRTSDEVSPTCPLCPSVRVLDLSGPDHLKHMGAHILTDHRVKDRPNPCGFCLRSDCNIVLGRSGQAYTVDLLQTDCPLKRQVRLKLAKEYDPKQPCTNHPLHCPGCKEVVWKYNLEKHLSGGKHSRTDKTLYQSYYQRSSDEDTLMRGVLMVSTRAKPSRSKKKALAISAQHSSRVALNPIASRTDSAQDINDDNSMLTATAGETGAELEEMSD
ncbi:hypothetical protein CPC08DRAFT_771434 [Agrocybe pediades]|nr:hypothetical protein CPC08DRAFT_771434 [Agrocybe pediades]